MAPRSDLLTYRIVFWPDGVGCDQGLDRVRVRAFCRENARERFLDACEVEGYPNAEIVRIDLVTEGGLS